MAVAQTTKSMCRWEFWVPDLTGFGRDLTGSNSNNNDTSLIFEDLLTVLWTDVGQD